LIFRSLGLQVGVVRSDGTVELRSVKVGRDFGQNIEIVSGVTPADQVIANPTDSLVDGVKVRLQSAPGAAGAN
jgi:multidrug efflux pump subunit AcrA (membrane-fusion protein)